MTFREAFENKYPNSGYILKRMAEFSGKEPEWNDFTKSHLIGIASHFKSVMSNSSARTSLACVKSVLNDFSDEIKIPAGNFSDLLTVRNEKSTFTWLTTNELKLIEDYVPKSDVERYVRNTFLIGAYTGARHSDFIHFDEQNVVDGMLMYVSQKTKIQATIPLKPIVLELMKEPMQPCSDVTYNKTIRRIAMYCGINAKIKLFSAGEHVSGHKYQFITSHTARRSFATNLYLCGVDLLTISKMMGHTSIEMTQNYVVCGIRELGDKVLGYFK